MMELRELIERADARCCQSEAKWQQKHMPIRIKGKLYWLTAEVPPDIQEVLDQLPEDREDGAVQRVHQVKTRLSADELESFDLLVKASGLPQGEYIRGMILNGRVSVTQTSLVDAGALENLTELSAELGRIAGMIRMTVIVNKEFAILTGTEKEKLEKDLRDLRKLQVRIQTLAEDIYGHLQA